jgi:mortality factor 4-like protein 1
MLGSHLLYKFERVQYAELLDNNTSVGGLKEMCDIYGSIHLLRLIDRLNQILLLEMPLELISLENLIQNINEILKYLDKNNEKLFNVSNYILTTPDYIRLSI